MPQLHCPMGAERRLLLIILVSLRGERGLCTSHVFTNSSLQPLLRPTSCLSQWRGRGWCSWAHDSGELIPPSSLAPDFVLPRFLV